MDDKIIIDRMDAEEFLSMLTDAAMQGDNVTQYYSTTQIIENIANEFTPASDVAPVTHGEWIEDDYGYNRCSACGWEWDEPEAVSLYCPHCGAKMEEGEIDA